jgi:hypothetical protein
MEGERNALPEWYARCYCEENIYRLIQIDQSITHAVFISNTDRKVPFFSQPSDSGMIIWDYHVIAYSDQGRLVYDFDSAVPFPAPLSTYIGCVLQPEAMSNAEDTFQRKYRMISRIEFLEKFSSDRSHMLDENGNYNVTPPRDDPIRNGPDNLKEFISMERGSGVGSVFDEREFLDYLGVE